jgi:dTDP-4-amino-4,6-dideoxygalactose transaminase
VTEAAAIKRPAGAHGYRIPFNQASVVGTEEACVADAIRSGHLAATGAFTRQCEARLEALVGARKALLTSSCTHALEAAALLLDVEPGDEVVVPSFSFVSTANAFASRGLRPVFADAQPGTLNLDVALLPGLVTPRTRAIVAMHDGGVACDMDAITRVAAERGLMVVEDNAHGLFGKYKGRPLGSFGTFAARSFHQTKNITCGEGGALLVNDPAFVDRAEVAVEKGTNRGRFSRGEVDRYTWVGPGSNYRPSELQAAFLWGQLSAASAIQERRHAIWSRYHAGLETWARKNEVRRPAIPSFAEHPAHVYFVILPSSASRRALIAQLKAQGILAVFHYQPLHLSPMGQQFGARPGDCPVAEQVSERLVRLPFYNDLTPNDQDEVIDAVARFAV